MHVRLMVLTSWRCIQHPSKKKFKLKFNPRTRRMPKPATELSRDIESSVIIPQCTLNLNRLTELQGGGKSLGYNIEVLTNLPLVWGGDLRIRCHKKGAREAVPTFELQGDWRTLAISCTPNGLFNVFSVEEVADRWTWLATGGWTPFVSVQRLVCWKVSLGVIMLHWRRYSHLVSWSFFWGGGRGYPWLLEILTCT